LRCHLRYRRVSQMARLLEKVTHRVKTVTFGLE
jgi:hypothetical protein